MPISPELLSRVAAGFKRDGHALLPAALDDGQIERLLGDLQRLQLQPLRGGIRRIEQLSPAVAELTAAPALLQLIQPHLAAPARLVRALYFNKTPQNNWLVSWHQDRTVAVARRFEAEGWGPWSLKEGVWHVQPPLAVLEQMVTLRLHLDDAGRDNGCLKLIPGSHRLGIMRSEECVTQAEGAVVYCEVRRGDVLLMRPHVLHASDKSAVPANRRILHFEYCAFELPAGVTWAP